MYDFQTLGILKSDSFYILHLQFLQKSASLARKGVFVLLLRTIFLNLHAVFMIWWCHNIFWSFMSRIDLAWPPRCCRNSCDLWTSTLTPEPRVPQYLNWISKIYLCKFVAWIRTCVLFLTQFLRRTSSPTKVSISIRMIKINSVFL